GLGEARWQPRHRHFRRRLNRAGPTRLLGWTWLPTRRCWPRRAGIRAARTRPKTWCSRPCWPAWKQVATIPRRIRKALGELSPAQRAEATALAYVRDPARAVELQFGLVRRA